jgi:hypothetical protein
MLFQWNLEILLRVRPIDHVMPWGVKIKAIAIDSMDMQNRGCLYTAPFPLKDAFP